MTKPLSIICAGGLQPTVNSMCGMRFNGPTRANQFSQTVHQSATLRQSVLNAICGVTVTSLIPNQRLAVRFRADGPNAFKSVLYCGAAWKVDTQLLFHGIIADSTSPRMRESDSRSNALPPQQSTFKEIMAARLCSYKSSPVKRSGRCRQSQPHRKRGDSGFRCLGSGSQPT